MWLGLDGIRRSQCELLKCMDSTAVKDFLREISTMANHKGKEYRASFCGQLSRVSAFRKII